MQSQWNSQQNSIIKPNQDSEMFYFPFTNNLRALQPIYHDLSKVQQDTGEEIETPSFPLPATPRNRK